MASAFTSRAGRFRRAAVSDFLQAAL